MIYIYKRISGMVFDKSIEPKKFEDLRTIQRIRRFLQIPESSWNSKTSETYFQFTKNFIFSFQLSIG